jgi:hypothetical protein
MVNSESTMCRTRILGCSLMHSVPLFDAAMLGLVTSHSTSGWARRRRDLLVIITTYVFRRSVYGGRSTYGLVA